MYLAGTRFILRSDHNPLTHLRAQTNPRGKSGRWLSELEEFDYTIEYIWSSNNVKADALSRNEAASLKQPPPELDNKIYSIFTTNNHVQTLLQQEQLVHPLLKDALQHMSSNSQIPTGHLKRIQKHLCIEKGLLTKSGCPVVAPSL